MRKTLAALFCVNVLNIYDRNAISVIIEPLRREFHLTDQQLGALSTAFIIVYALAGVPLGRLADRWSRKRVLVIGVAVWAGMTALGGLSTSYWMLFATRLGVGIGEAVCAPAAASWIAGIVAPERRSRAMAILMMAIPVGIMLSFAVSGPVAQTFGWRTALVLAAVPAVVLVPWLLWLDEPAATGRAAKPAPVGTLLRIPAFWWITLSGALVNFILYSFSFFGAAFLTRFHGLTVAQAGVWTGLGSGVAGAAGALVVIAVRGQVRLAAWAALAAAPLAWIAIGLPRGNAAAAIALLMLAYGCWQMYYGPVYAAIQDLVPAELRATAMSLYFLGMYLCGGAFGPLAVGWLSDRFAAAVGGDRAAGLHQAMYAIPLLSLALAAVLAWSARVAARRVRIEWTTP